MGKYNPAGPMLNAYPDSMGGTLGDIVEFLSRPELKDVFGSFYILPSIFNTDLDRGFSVIDYGVNKLMGSAEDLDTLRGMGIDLKLDFILNHLSVLSKPFQDIIAKGEESEYKDFFINWNRFWEGHGQMTEDGYIQPDAELIKDMFFRKPGLPILMVRFPDGTNVPYWNTFYQEVRYSHVDAQDLMRAMDIQYGSADALSALINAALDAGKTPADIDFGKFEAYKAASVELLESRRKYLGQMDVNIKSPLVWDYYDDTLKNLAAYGASIVRLDAFAYAPKEPGLKNFLNEPGTWELLAKVRELADKYGVTLLPEIHASYGEKTYQQIADQGYMTYDFFLPGLIIDALDRGDNTYLMSWAREIIEKDMRVVNMLGCHDGIPLLDLKGLLPEELIQNMIDVVVGRGGFVKDLHGQKNVYYQVNATYYSALGDDDRKMLLARALQLFMPGKPQVWYLDVFAGKNDHEAVRLAGPGGHKEINRTNIPASRIDADISKKVVADQLELLRFRNTFGAFGFDSKLTISDADTDKVTLTWEKDGCVASLTADLKGFGFSISASENGKTVFTYNQD